MIIYQEVWSQTLQMQTQLTVTIPDPAGMFTPRDTPLQEIYTPKKYPTIYLCHCGTGSNRDWVSNTRVALYANQKQVMTVSMDLGNSFGRNMKIGQNYFDWITEELPLMIQTMYPSSSKREDTFVIGFSMGAHAAMKFALRCPEKYAAVWAMSGAKDQVKMQQLARKQYPGNDTTLTDAAFGPTEEIYGSENDLLFLADQLAKSQRPKPLIFHSCGLQDYGLQLCREYAEYLSSVGLENCFFTPNGIHDWLYADEMLQKAMTEYLPIRST